MTTRRLQQLEKDNADLEAESEAVGKEMEALRVAVKRLDGKEKEASQMEVEMARLHKDKANADKENRSVS